MKGGNDGRSHIREICFLDRPDPLRQVRAAKLAEERGFKSCRLCDATGAPEERLWISGRDGRQHQPDLLGTGIVNSWTRGPALMALTFATLDEMAPGRTICGLAAPGTRWPTTRASSARAR